MTRGAAGVASLVRLAGGLSAAAVGDGSAPSGGGGAGGVALAEGDVEREARWAPCSGRAVLVRLRHGKLPAAAHVLRLGAR